MTVASGRPILRGVEGYEDLELRTVESARVGRDDLAAMHALFDLCYREANHAYLEKSLTVLKHLALAYRNGVLAGFALAEHRVLDLPRLPGTDVNLAGMSCIHPDFRRRRLFVTLERAASLAGGHDITKAVRVLGCGRMAHPASFRGMTVNPTVVPKPGVAPTAWQRAVGQAIADAYGVREFDARTFVCRGSGVPIGYPVLDLGDVRPGEWEVFREVDRDRGDSLLGIAWTPGAPEGWEAP